MMDLTNKSILLFGATGGIGSQLTWRLVNAGAHLILTGRNRARLEHSCNDLSADMQLNITLVEADITSEEGRQVILDTVNTCPAGLDVIINCSGISSFGLFEESMPEDIERVMQTNVTAPVILIRMLLPALKKSSSAHVMNIGSIFGSIGFAGFSLYSMSKFALRGFSEALARELDDSGIIVSYVAPRATRTDFNSSAIKAMNMELGVSMDDPGWVADKIIQSLRNGRKQTYLGWPERLFVKLNSLVPGLVDIFLVKQLPIIKRFATRTAAQAAGECIK